MKQRVNVLYLTTRCNLKCDYCYELNSRNVYKKDLTEEDIDDFLDEISKREKGLSSTLVIMGGEPFLKWKLLKYTVDKAFKMNHSFGISVTTNGTILNKKYSGAPSIFELKELVSKISTLEISYDGSGHDRRVFSEGSSSRKMVENSLRLLRENDIPFRISYTVHIVVQF